MANKDVSCRVAIGLFRTRVLPAVVAVGLILGCISCYHQQFRPGDLSHVATPEYELYFVEADDEGWFWEPAQAERAYAAVEKSAADHDTIVVTFVHGWHHSVSCCDGNLEGFEEVLRLLHRELDKRMYEGTRAELQGRAEPEPIRIVGIFVGWRGRSLPWLLDYATFWGRKASAERVGDTDLQELMIRLKNFYERHTHPEAPQNAPSADNTLLGLITIGHSFGGEVVLRAVAPFLEHRLADLNMNAHGYLRDRVPASACAGTPAESSREPLRGFGDLVILINPAVEAAAYQRLFSLAQQHCYGNDQTPVLLTLSAENDGPRHHLFSAGRIAGEFFTARPRKKDGRERRMERQALGFFSEQVTHLLQPAIADPELAKEKKRGTVDPGCKETTHCNFDWYEWRKREGASVADSVRADRFTEREVQKLATYDFSSLTTLRDVQLVPLSGSIPYQPLIVAAVKPTIIDGHNGMFSAPLMRFLASYIGLLEAKKLQPMMTPKTTTQPDQSAGKDR